MSRIYLVDDHELVRDGIRAMVEAGGHEVVGVAEDPAAALVDLARLAPAVLLLDLKLADDRSGLEILTELRRRASRVRTLVLTMSRQSRDVGDAIRLGAAGYLLKSASRAELLQAIEVVLAGKVYLGRDVGPLAVDALTSDPGANPLAPLSVRERQIVAMVVQGKTSVMIGQLLGLSPKTVDTYRSRSMTKLGVADLASLVRFAIRIGLVDANDR